MCAPVAQGIERLPPEQKAAGSNPAGGTVLTRALGRAPSQHVWRLFTAPGQRRKLLTGPISDRTDAATGMDSSQSGARIGVP